MKSGSANGADGMPKEGLRVSACLAKTVEELNYPKKLFVTGCTQQNICHYYIKYVLSKEILF